MRSSDYYYEQFVSLADYNSKLFICNYIQLTTGVKFLHNGGVVHGDLNSLNVLITEFGNAIVTGFGHSINHTSLLATSHINGQVRTILLLSH